MKHSDKQLIKKIISECQDIMRYTNDISRDTFLVENVYQKAIAMSLLNIGEFANSLSRDLWYDLSDIPWRKIVGLRNIVAHGYGEINMELIWNLSEENIPLLIQQLETVLKQF
jgi:uncharacterized protein with HEPN domain